MEKPKWLEHLSDEHLEHRMQIRKESYMYIEWVRNMIDNDLKNFIFEEWNWELNMDDKLKFFYDDINEELVKIEKYIDPELWKEDLAEIEFLRYYIKELLKTFYDNRKFSEVFENKEWKENFLILMKKYLYTEDDNYRSNVWVIGLFYKKYPKHNWILTVEEIDELLDKWLAEQKKD